jgi:hypothetical protein
MTISVTNISTTSGCWNIHGVNISTTSGCWNIHGVNISTTSGCWNIHGVNICLEVNIHKVNIWFVLVKV